ncbi:MAG: hypothetical protein ACKVHS_09225, partial [Flavobacteriales bacterium]
TAEEVKTLYQMGRCDEGGHVVNFSKTRVGIGLGDEEVPQAALDVKGDASFGSKVGIGTPSPTTLATLDVNGNIKSRGNLYLAPATIESDTKVGTKDTFLLMHHSTFHGSLGPNYPRPECGTIMTNRSGGGTFPWLMYTGLVKDVATTTPTSSLRMDWGQGSSTGTATDLVDATLNPLMTLRFNGNLGIGTTDPDTKLNMKSGVFLAENQASTNGMVLYYDAGGSGGSNNNQYAIGNAKLGVAQFVNDTGTTGSTITLVNKELTDNTTKHASIGFVNTDTSGNGKFGGQIGFWPEGGNAIKQQFRIYTSGASSGYNLPVQRMVVEGDGNVGIGTDTPGASLQVAGSGIKSSGYVTTNGISISMPYNTWRDVVDYRNYTYGRSRNFIQCYRYGLSLAGNAQFFVWTDTGNWGANISTQLNVGGIAFQVSGNYIQAKQTWYTGATNTLVFTVIALG